MTESVDIARTRQGLYRFFGEALLPPDEDRFALLAEAALVMSERGIDSFAFGPPWRRLAHHFPVDVSGDGLDVDYVRLFASGRSGALAPPTESYYRVPGKGGGIAEFVGELQREIRRMGIALVDPPEAPDHASTQLEVMAHLCDLEAGGWASEALDRVQGTLAWEHRFLTTHLQVWFPQFRRRVVSAPRSEIYVDLIEAVHAFIVHETDYVSLIRRELAA